MYIFIYICISISPSSHAGGRCNKINTHMHEWEYEDAATDLKENWFLLFSN